MGKNEIVIAQTDELQNGEMKTIYTDDGPEVLLIKINDKFYATAPYCPHYEAPLETGLLSDKRIMCPWHHAVFNAQTGEAEEPPALEGLKRYKLEVRGKDIILFPEETLTHKESDYKQKKDKRTFLIIGSGAAGNAAARKLRELDFEGHLIMITADSHPPYDRTALSKDFLKGDMDPEWLPLNHKDYFKKNGIELILGQKVKQVHSNKKIVELENKTKIEYDKLLIASGGKPRQLDVPGNKLNNIYTLRSMNDADRIVKSAENVEQIAIIGASFIGMETAESLNNENRSIHIIAPGSLPFGSLFGNELGKLIKKKKDKEGIVFHLGKKVSEFRGNGNLKEIILDDGESINAELAVIGIGVNPVTEFMPQFDKVTDGSLLTDEYLQVENDVFAAGDVVKFPYWKTDKLIRIEHWRVAEQQGTIAAYNMLGMKRKIEIIPFFWTSISGLSIRYVGYAGQWDDTIIQGDVSQDEFIIYYIANNKVNAALGVNKDEYLTIIEELLRKGKMPGIDKLKKEIISVKDLMKLL